MNLEKYMIPCLSKTLLGIECLGCGFQRALLLLLQGKFTEAFAMYPALFTSLLLLLVFILHYFNKRRNYKPALITLAAVNGIFMIAGYYYKQM